MGGGGVKNTRGGALKTLGRGGGIDPKIESFCNADDIYFGSRRYRKINKPVNCSEQSLSQLFLTCRSFDAKFELDSLTFQVIFTPVTFRFASSNFLSLSQVSADKLKWRQFTSKSQMKSAPKLVYFFTSIL